MGLRDKIKGTLGSAAPQIEEDSLQSKRNTVNEIASCLERIKAGAQAVIVTTGGYDAIATASQELKQCMDVNPFVSNEKITQVTHRYARNSVAINEFAKTAKKRLETMTTRIVDFQAETSAFKNKMVARDKLHLKMQMALADVQKQKALQKNVDKYEGVHQAIKQEFDKATIEAEGNADAILARANDFLLTEIDELISIQRVFLHNASQEHQKSFDEVGGLSTSAALEYKSMMASSSGHSLNNITDSTSSNNNNSTADARRVSASTALH